MNIPIKKMAAVLPFHQNRLSEMQTSKAEVGMVRPITMRVSGHQRSWKAIRIFAFVKKNRSDLSWTAHEQSMRTVA